MAKNKQVDLTAFTKTELTTRQRRVITLHAAELRRILGLDAKARLTVHVPGGGDWSNIDLSLVEETEFAA